MPVKGVECLGKIKQWVSPRRGASALHRQRVVRLPAQEPDQEFFLAAMPNHKSKRWLPMFVGLMQHHRGAAFVLVVRWVFQHDMLTGRGTCLLQCTILHTPVRTRSAFPSQQSGRLPIAQELVPKVVGESDATESAATVSSE